MLDNVRTFGEIKLSLATMDARQAHQDIHFLWRLRRGLSFLLADGSEENPTYKVTEQDLMKLHEEVVADMIARGSGHWFDSFESALDMSLPEELKLASDGYDPPGGGGLLKLTEEDLEERKIYEDCRGLESWKAPTKRKDVPASHFFDSKNKKYPYKNPDGSINCGGVLAAKRMAAGARSGKKATPAIQARINRVWESTCGGGGKDKDKKKKK
jgi:hypothetical protein